MPPYLHHLLIYISLPLTLTLEVLKKVSGTYLYCVYVAVLLLQCDTFVFDILVYIDALFSWLLSWCLCVFFYVYIFSNTEHISCTILLSGQLHNNNRLPLSCTRKVRVSIVLSCTFVCSIGSLGYLVTLIELDLP